MKLFSTRPSIGARILCGQTSQPNFLRESLEQAKWRLLHPFEALSEAASRPGQVLREASRELDREIASVKRDSSGAAPGDSHHGLWLLAITAMIIAAFSYVDAREH